jgi:hypothetical protein
MMNDAIFSIWDILAIVLLSGAIGFGLCILYLMRLVRRLKQDSFRSFWMP